MKKFAITLAAVALTSSLALVGFGCAPQEPSSGTSNSSAAVGSVLSTHQGRAGFDLTEATVEGCLNAECHQHSEESQVAATENYGTALFNPHESHISYTLECSDCHSMSDTPTLYCNKCHNADLPVGWENPDGKAVAPTELSD